MVFDASPQQEQRCDDPSLVVLMQQTRHFVQKDHGIVQGVQKRRRVRLGGSAAGAVPRRPFVQSHNFICVQQMLPLVSDIVFSSVFQWQGRVGGLVAV